MAKTALEKLNDPKHAPQIEPLPSGSTWGPEGAPMLISTPREIYDLMASVPDGKIMLADDMRDHLAQKHGAMITCPLTTGIFMNIASRAAEELRDQTGEVGMAWWRVVKKAGALNEKAPGGPENHKRLLAAEGHDIVPKGKKNFKLADFEKARFIPS